MGSFLLELGRVFGAYAGESLLAMTWTDFLDVAFMTVFSSFALAMLQRRTSRSILIAVFPLFLTFIAARNLNMYLTSKLLQFGLTVFTVGLVIVFQEDFRRAFESLSSWRLWSRRESFLSNQIADILVDRVFAFAKTKTGALIVIGGRQPIEGHLRAGIPLNGQLSGPLLDSIFDSGSAGHDGAVIILNGVVERFGAHLPLSRDAHHTGRLGTRHAAALGLVEKSDALVLVVSEETGTISVGTKGRLTPSKSVEDVRDAIRAHSKRLKPAPHRSLLEIPWMRLAASFLIAFFLWTTYARPVVGLRNEQAQSAAPTAPAPQPELARDPLQPGPQR